MYVSTYDVPHIFHLSWKLRTMISIRACSHNKPEWSTEPVNAGARASCVGCALKTGCTYDTYCIHAPSSNNKHTSSNLDERKMHVRSSLLYHEYFHSAMRSIVRIVRWARKGDVCDRSNLFHTSLGGVVRAPPRDWYVRTKRKPPGGGVNTSFTSFY